MITFSPTDEQQMLIDAIHRYAENNIRKVAHDADEASEAPADVIGKGWELGILPGLIPEDYGGYADDQPAITGVLALEELAWGDLSIAMEVWGPALFALPVLISGTEEQKQEYLPLFCDVGRPPMTAALMEPRITFDPFCPATTADRANGQVSINGSKAYVPLAADAEKMIVYATDTSSGQVNGYIVDTTADGVQIGDREMLMGIRALPTYRVAFDNVTIPADRTLGGDEGTNYRAIINRSRIALGALGVGVARASLEYAIDYAKERVQFGVPIATKQAVAFKLAEMAIEVDAARLLVWEAAWQADQGADDLTKAAALVSDQVTRMTMFVTDGGVQTLGGYGYIREYPAERWLRNARGFAAFEGLALV